MKRGVHRDEQLELNLGNGERAIARNSSTGHTTEGCPLAEVFSLSDKKIEREQSEEKKLYREILNLVTHFR